MNTVDHPKHYQGAALETRVILETLGIPRSLMDGECIMAIELLHLNFHIGNAVKYLWRYGQKSDSREDLQKARWYLNREWMWQDQPENSNVKRAIEQIDEILEVAIDG